MDSDVFRKISAADQEKIYTDLATGKVEIQGKDAKPGTNLAIFKVIGFERAVLVCRMIKSDIQFDSKGEITITFLLGGEKYFLHTEYRIQSDQFYLETEAPLYHVQRREDFRLKFPSNFQVYLEVQNWNGNPHNIKLLLADLSGGGMRVLVPARAWAVNLGDTITGQLQISGGGLIPISAKVKHIKPSTQNKDQLFCGMHFHELTEPQKNKIAALVMDLYRKIFIRKNQ